MSVQFTQQPQQVVEIDLEPRNDEDDRQRLQSPEQRVPLDRMTSRLNPYSMVQEQLTQVQVDISREERAERIRVRRIFDKYDVNRDGRLSRKELKRLMKENPGQCQDLPKGISKEILKYADTDHDGYLDFEEFYKLSQEHKWIAKEFCVKYCRYIVPRRDGAIHDETEPGPECISDLVGACQCHHVYVHDFHHKHLLNKEEARELFEYGAYESQMKFFPPPLTMVIFSIIEVVFFIIDIIYLSEYIEPDIKNIGTSVNGPMAQVFIYNPRKREQAWRFVTYMFVHVGVMHIMMNLIVQIFLGTALELVHCWWRVALVYLSGVAAGSMGTSIANPRIFLAGASGGVYALITAHIATIIMNWHEMEYAFIQLFVFLVFCGTDIGFSIHRHITDPFDRVGYMAHLCGGIAGLLVGIGVLRNLNVRPYEKKLWWFAVTVYSALMISGILFHIFNPDYFIFEKITQSPSSSGFP